MHENLYSLIMYRVLLTFVLESMSKAFRLQEPQPKFLSFTAFSQLWISCMDCN